MQIRKITGITISIISVFTAMAVILWFYFRNGFAGLQGAIWLLAIIGAPTTFLCVLFEVLGLSDGLMMTLIWTTFFYLLQYQIVALWVHRTLIGSKVKIPLKMIVLIIAIFFVIMLGAKMMWNMIMGGLH